MKKWFWPICLLALVMAIGGAGVFRRFMKPARVETTVSKVMETDGSSWSNAPPADVPAIQTRPKILAMIPPNESNLANRMRRDSRGLEAVTHPGGRQSVHLGGRFQHVTALVPNASGGREVKCFSSYQELTESGKTQTSSHESAPTAGY